jgi:GNAT superfamily N-acetyltransferase
MTPGLSSANGGSLSAIELCLCEGDGLLRQLEPDDWRRLRDARLRALASDPGAFLVTLDEARKFPDEHWRERAMQTESNVTFVYERVDGFDAMVGAFSRDDADSVYLVGMWVAPDLRGSGVARQLVERVVAWARGRGCSRVVLSVEGNNSRAARFYEKCGFTELIEPPPLPYEPRPGNRFYAYTL